MDPKLLMKTGKQLCEIGTALLSACEGMSNGEEENEGESEGLLSSKDESVEEGPEDEMPEDDSSAEPEVDDEDRKKRVRLAKLKLNKGR